MWFRKFLLSIKHRWYADDERTLTELIEAGEINSETIYFPKLMKNRKALVRQSIIILVLFGAGAFLSDIFLPWNAWWWSAIRAAIMLPLALSMFIIGYCITIMQGDERAEKFKDGDEPYVSLREQFSPAWRRRFSAIIGAFLFVITFAFNGRFMYTFVFAICGAIAIGLFVFMRLTSEEQARAELNIPDPRDLEQAEKLRELQAEKKNKKNKKKSKNDDDDDDDDIEPDEDEED